VVVPFAKGKAVIGQKFPPARCVAVDVDGTLLIGSRPNARLIEWCWQKKNEGFRLMLWSARGKDHAINAARLCGVMDLFDAIESKPGYIVDDLGWSWIKFTKIVRDVTMDLTPEARPSGSVQPTQIDSI